jgi:hypothetical protein
MDKLFYISPTQRAHVARHFNQTDLAGSHFYTASFATPESLVAYVNDTEPIEIIAQSETRFAFRFASITNQSIGTCGLALRSELKPEQFTQVVREGYTIEIGIVDQLPETSEFCVIADDKSDGFSIITAFPGGYARPFAQKSQPVKEYALNKQFWEEHVLLKQKEN